MDSFRARQNVTQKIGDATLPAGHVRIARADATLRFDPAAAVEAYLAAAAAERSRIEQAALDAERRILAAEALLAQLDALAAEADAAQTDAAQTDVAQTDVAGPVSS